MDFTARDNPNEAGRGALVWKDRSGRHVLIPPLFHGSTIRPRGKRGSHTLPNNDFYSRLSQLLRVVGDYLDQRNVSGFRILWKRTPAKVDFIRRRWAE